MGRVQEWIQVLAVAPTMGRVRAAETGTEPGNGMGTGSVAGPTGKALEPEFG